MGGSIHFQRDRFYISLYWHGRHEKFWRYQDEPLYDRRTAFKLLSKIQADIDNGCFDPRTYKPNNPLTLKAFSEHWISLSTACRNTKRRYRYEIGRVISYFGTDHDIRHFTHSKLLQFYQEVTGSDDTKYHVLTTLKTMLRFYKKDVPAFMLPEFPPLTQPVPEETKYLTYDEQAKVLEAIPERHRPIFIIMMEYGLRPQEATALKWDCIEAGKIIFRRSHSEYELREKTKTGAVRIEDLTTRASQAIVESGKLPASKHGWVFYHNKRGSHYDNKILNRIWNAACEASGVKNIGLYESVRHSLGCQLADAGYSIDFIQDVYKHTSIKTTRRYAKRSRHLISEALESRGKVVPFAGCLLEEKRSPK